MTNKRILLLINILATTSVAASEQPVRCFFTGAISIDGSANEDDWKRWQGETRLLWDRQYLYILGRASGKSDAVALRIKPASDKPGVYEFQLKADGTMASHFTPGPGKTRTGDFHFEARVAEHKGGWSAEARVPWADFLRAGGRPNPGDVWQLSIGSNADFKPLAFVGPDNGVKRALLTTSRVTGAPEPPPPFRIKKVFPKIDIPFPIFAIHQPYSDRLIIIHSKRNSGSTTIVRMRDDQDADTVEKLLDDQDISFSIAFHPDFKNNGYLYIGSNGPQSAPAEKRHTRVTRYTMERQEPFQLDPGSAKEIISWWSDGHNGGAVTFGHDGMLYITSGDGTSDSDTRIVGQDMSSLLAKVLRIDVDHPAPGKTYRAPKDNPFVSLPGARPEIWAVGLRNPWRITTDARTGHIWVGQNGQDLWEQAYLVKKGDNYGWSVMEGSHPFYPNRKPGPLPFVKPTVEHHHTEARSLTGGIVYYGRRFPELQGAYIYGDYSTGKVWGVRHDGDKILWHKELADTRLQITSFAADALGELLITDHRELGKAGVYTLERTPDEGRTSTFPRTLSDSGLFHSVKGHEMAPGVVAYDVIAPLWGDNAYKQRWVALPGDGRIEFSPRRGWNCPDQTVIVKSFGLEMEPGNPASRRWIETRFLTNQKGEWYGYSYAWNDEQTEGTLVDAKGLDREFSIKEAGGVRKQVWHFPSRTECMVCHSRAANWLLGLSLPQMSATQLLAFERAGVFKIDWAGSIKNRKHADAAGQRAPAVSSLLAAAPETYGRLVDPYDATCDINLRARSYLHSNCAQCHVDAGGGNAQINLDSATVIEKMNLFDVKPLHDAYGLPNARLVAPGAPESSVLLHRMALRGRGQMPPLATSLVDEPAVEMLREWIKQLKQ